MRFETPFKSVLDTIGDTPLLKVRNMDTGPCELYLKLENQNPGGSIKDRIALSMIEAAEKEGKIKPGTLIVEATAGNTGLGLALVAIQKGYRLRLFIPDKMSQEKILHLKAMGAEVVITRSDVDHEHPEYYQNQARRFCQETQGSFHIDQFNNPANAYGHETTTGPEIWKQMNQKVDAVIVGVGSGGTIAGLTHFFKKIGANTEMVLADPAGSLLKEFVETGKMTGHGGPWLVEGLGGDSVPSVADFSSCKKAYAVTDAESFEAAREALLKEGVFGGSSSGTLLAAALKYCRESKTPKRVVTFICDSGNKYLSKFYNDHWMRDHGFIQNAGFGDLRDLVTRQFREGHVISVSSEMTLWGAYSRMKVHGFSQLPVIDQGEVLGMLDESDLLLAIAERKGNYEDLVRDHMTRDIQRVAPATSIRELMGLLDKGLVGVLYDAKGFFGLITRADVLSHLRRKSTVT